MRGGSAPTIGVGPTAATRVGDRRSRWFAFGPLLASLLVSGSAAAEDGFALSWRSAATRPCVSEAALREAVERRLGRTPFTDPEHAVIWIEGEESSPGRGRFRARVRQRGRGIVPGERELEPQTCDSLFRAAVLVVSLFIDRHQQEEQEGQRAESEPATTPTTDSPGPPAPEARSPRNGPARGAERIVVEPGRASATPGPARGLELRLGGGAGAAAGLLPSLDAMLFTAGRLEAERSRWSFEWRGGFHFPQRVQDRSVSGVFSAIDQRWLACVSPAVGRTARFDVCGGFVWAAIIPRARGTKRDKESLRILTGPTAAVALQLRGRGSAGRIELGLALPLRQYTFGYTGPNDERRSFYSTGQLLFLLSISGFRTIS